MEKWLVLDTKKHRALAKQWMKREKKWADILWRTVTIIGLLCVLWHSWNIGQELLRETAQHNADLSFLYIAVAFYLVLLLALVLATPYKLWRILAGGQLYYMSRAGLLLEDDKMHFCYHPRQDRHFPASIAYNTLPYSTIREITIDPDTQLVTIDGEAEFTLLRSVAGITTPVKNNGRQYKKWGMLQFFFALSEKDKDTFLQTMKTKNVTVRYLPGHNMVEI